MFFKTIIFILVISFNGDCLSNENALEKNNLSEIIIPTSLKLVGKANLNLLWWKIYKSELYTSTGKYEENIRPLVLKLTYQRKIKRDELVKETLSQWKSQGISIEQKKSWAQQLEKIWPDVKKKDSITFYADEKDFSHFYFNDKLVGSIVDVHFAKAFSDIWLAEGGEYPSLTKRLTGKSKKRK